MIDTLVTRMRILLRRVLRFLKSEAVSEARAQYNREVKELNDQLSRREEENAALKKQNSDLKLRVADMEKKLSSANSELGKLVESHELLQMNYREMHRSAAALAADLSDLLEGKPE